MQVCFVWASKGQDFSWQLQSICNFLSDQSIFCAFNIAAYCDKKKLHWLQSLENSWWYIMILETEAKISLGISGRLSGPTLLARNQCRQIIKNQLHSFFFVISPKVFKLLTGRHNLSIYIRKLVGSVLCTWLKKFQKQTKPA